MRRIAFCLLCLFLALPLHAQEYDYCAGAGGAAAVTYTDCSQIGTHAFVWYGDFSADNKDGCKGVSTSVDGTLDTSTITTVNADCTDALTPYSCCTGSGAGTCTSPTSGGNVLKQATANKYLRWPITGGDIASSSEGSVCFDVFLSASSSVNSIAIFYVNSSNYVRFQIGSTNTVIFTHNGNASMVAVTSTDTVADTTWTTICGRWSVTNNKVSIKIGAGSWKDDSDADTVTAFAAEPSYLYIGYDAVADSPFYIDNLLVDKVSGL